VRNCTYYWGFAAFIAYFIFHPLYMAPPVSWQVAGIILWLMGEIGNLTCHLHLARLRLSSSTTPQHSSKHPVPTMWMFKWVVCPNYTAEILSWLGFNMVCLPFLFPVHFFENARQREHLLESCL